MKSQQMTAWLIVVASVLVSFFVPSSHATLWMSPVRPLTDDERMEMAVSTAHAVGVGDFIALGDSLDREGMSWRWMTRSPGAEYWAMSEHPEFPGSGLVRLAEKPGIEDDAKRVVTLQTPEGMARRSGLIVVGEARLGRRPGTVLTRAYGKKIPCTEFRVDSVIAGAHPGSVIKVYGPYGTAVTKPGPFLLMIRPGESGAFELIGLRAGARPIRHGWVEGFDESLAKIAIRLRQASRLTTPKPKK